MSVVLWCRRADGLHRKVGVDRAEVSRGRSTGGGTDISREGPNVRCDGGIGLLVLVAMIAAIPRTRASCREETVSSVEHRS